MAEIPNSINGVQVMFSSKVNKNVDQALVDCLRHCIRHDIAPGHSFRSVYISSANDQHSLPSRHAQMKAVDISRINGTKMIIGYLPYTDVKAIVDAIQSRFETFIGRRENFGPSRKAKHGQDFSIGGHKDHIHLSVD